MISEPSEKLPIRAVVPLFDHLVRNFLFRPSDDRLIKT
jgi:hypothetical protein